MKESNQGTISWANHRLGRSVPASPNSAPDSALARLLEMVGQVTPASGHALEVSVPSHSSLLPEDAGAASLLLKLTPS